MNKKLVSLLLAGTMTASLLAGCGSSNKPADNNASNDAPAQTTADGQNTDNGGSDTASVLKDGKNSTITMVFPGNSSAPGSITEVEEAMTAIANETIDCTIDLQILEWGVYAEQTNLMLSSGEDVDIVFALGTVQTAANTGQIIDISGMIDAYAPETVELMGRYIDGCYVGDKLYGLPSYHEFGSGAGIVVLTKYLDELGIDPATIKTWDDVEGMLAKFKEKYPDKDVLVPADIGAGMMMHSLNGTFDSLVSNATMVGVYADGSDGLTVHNIYATPEYKEMAERAYDWQQKGYFIADATTITDTRQTFLAAGSCFGYIGIVHPGTATQESINAGADVTTIPITQVATGTSNVAGSQYTIPTASDAPEKALAVLNLICSNPDMQNLIHFGIEGKDYVVKSEGVAGYPEGVDNTTVGWTNETWLTGNAPIGLAWETEPEGIWDLYEEWNNSAVISPAYGFTYDTANVKNEITAVKNAIDKYSALIAAGLSDPAESVPEFLAELESAGINNIVEDAQAQLDAWAEANK